MSDAISLALDGAMLREAVLYEADGLRFRGVLLHKAAEARRPGILVFPEAFGIGPQSLARAERLAERGHVVLACDLHGDGRYIDDLPQAMALLQPLFDDPQRSRRRAIAALEALVARPEVDSDRLAAIGFCFPIPLELARSGAPLKAVVGFHTSLATAAPMAPGDNQGVRILACIGGDDPFVTAAQRAAFEAEMRNAGVDWQLNVYGDTVHSFTSPEAARRNMPDAIRYSARSDARAWQAMLALFAEVFGNEA